MSRRHKDVENDPQKLVMSHADSRQEEQSSNQFNEDDLVNHLTVVQEGQWHVSYKGLVASILKTAIETRQYETDDAYLKFPWESLRGICKQLPKIGEKTPKRGRPSIKMLFEKIADSKVVEMFKKTIHAVKEKCVELYENVTQFSVCFLKGIYQAFNPDEEPYGVMSHYHSVLKNEIEGLPSRRTLSDYYNWFVKWEESSFETAKEKKEKVKHRLWEKLISWIVSYLKELAPQYVVN